jgi:hypothetical protein
VGLYQADDGRSSGAVCGGEEGAAPFGGDQLIQWEDVCYRSSLVVVPKLHRKSIPGGFGSRKQAR